VSVHQIDVDSASSGAPRSTGLQMATAILAAALDALEQVATPHECADALDIHQRVVARKLTRYERWLRRAA
jgi:hypothetical protein